MHRRVRLLYLEFMYLVPQLEGFYTPRGAAPTPAKALRSAPDTFFLRVAEDHPVCAPLRATGAVQFQTPSQNFGEGTRTTPPETPTVVFKLQKPEEMQLLDVHMPKNWRTGRGPAAPAAGANAAGESWPSAESEFRAHVQRLFYANALVPKGCPEWKRCLARGRYELRGIQNVLHVRKYRALKKRYGWASQLSRTELEAVWAGDIRQVEQALLGLSNKDIYGYANADEDEEAEESAHGADT